MSRARSIRRRLPALVMAVTLALTVLAAGAAAQETEQVDVELPDLVVIFVLDLSGSMLEPFDDTRSKLDVVKEAFVEAFNNVSPDAFVGLRVYGDQIAPTGPANRELGCTTDSRLVVPITQLDRERLISEVQGFEALGDTPIGLALRQANDFDIPDGTLGTVVLFSDGRDECFDADLDGDPSVGPSWGENPCDVARDIAGEGVDLRIDRIETVGFRADEAAELELRCIADVSGGSYTPIETAADAREILPELLAEISSPREAERLGGESIVGTPTQAGAPEFARLDDGGDIDGRYVDTITMNTEKWYRLEEFGPGRGTFTATAFGLPAQEGISFGLRMYLPESDQTFFEGRADDNAGIPRRPTASIRCPGCSVTGGPNEVFWVVSLSAENPDLGGTYDLELLAEGPGFGGLSTTCEEPQECWYDSEIADRTETLEELGTDYEEQLAGQVPVELLDQRDDLQDAATRAEADAAEVGAHRDDLAAQAAELGDETTSLVLPLLIGLAGLVMLGAGLFLRRPAVAGVDSVEETDDAPSSVIGHIDTSRTEELATPPPPAPPTPVSGGEGGETGLVGSEESEDPQEIEQTQDPTETEGPEQAEDPGETEDADRESPRPDLVAPDLEIPDKSVLPAGHETSPSAGWYTDPRDQSLFRWWDGSEWTAHTHTAEER